MNGTTFEEMRQALEESQARYAKQRAKLASVESERDEALAIIERAKALHQPSDDEDSEWGGVTVIRPRTGCQEEWPCTTFAILNGEGE